jgi:uncharacterized protein (DUF2062 family)
MILKRRDTVSWTKKVRNFFWPEIGFQRAARYISHKVNRISGSPHAIALGFAAGAFASFLPFVGFHFILAAIIAWIIRGNILASALGTVVGNPLTFPFIWFITHNTGSWILGQQGRDSISLTGPEAGLAMMFAHPLQFFSELWAGLEPVFWPMLVGSIPLGLSCGIFCYVLLKPVVTRYKKRRKRLRDRRAAELRAIRKSAHPPQQGAGA